MRSAISAASIVRTISAAWGPAWCRNVQARGAQARHDQIAPLDVGMGRVRAQARAARVPAEVVHFVVGRELGLADDLAVARRAGIDVDRGDGVGRRRLGSKLATYASFSGGACAARRGEG